ncbi:MAG: polysaccharide export protein [Rhizobiales bacterium]|nr:polysaccharide export protein [Hyphomicrobiales bacterium]
MRPSRLIPIVMAALVATGCAHTSAPNGTTAARRNPTTAAPPANLDSLAYERRIAAPATAQAQPQPRPHAQPPITGTAMQARAQAVMPIVGQTRSQPAYALDTGDKLRIVVFGQEGLSNSYFVDAAGQVTIPLIGAVTARGLTTQQLARAVAAKLRAGFVREPHVAIEIETYRPFFILGEVIQPGQYPYVPNMTVETAVAIAGGFTPRAYRYDVKIDRPASGATVRSRASVPLLTRVMPGDTIVIKERWF